MTARHPLPAGVTGDATFSADRRYRYWLAREWDAGLPRFAYVLLNPSTAGAEADDRTSQRLRTLTAANGGGAYELVNLFAIVDTHQRLVHADAGVGESTEVADAWITEVTGRADVVILGWGDGLAGGVGGAARRSTVARRAAAVWPLVAGARPMCFVTNRSGAPRHPLYLRADSTPVPYRPAPEGPGFG